MIPFLTIGRALGVNPKIIRLFRHTKIENAIKKIKEEEEAKELQDKVYAQLLADIEANEKGE